MQEHVSVPASLVLRETRRVLARLRETIDDTSYSRREVEQRAGFSPGYLAQLFAENIELKMEHVISILIAAGHEPSRFLRALHPVPADGRRLRLPSDQDVASVYGFGIESLASLRERLDRFEGALSHASEPRGERAAGDGGPPRGGKPVEGDIQGKRFR